MCGKYSMHVHYSFYKPPYISLRKKVTNRQAKHLVGSGVFCVQHSGNELCNGKSLVPESYWVIQYTDMSLSCVFS